MSDAAIEVQDLRKSYVDGIFRRRFEALKGVTFSVAQGEVFGLLGPNGAGKTTFIKILLGIVRKTGGVAKMLGRTAGDTTGRKQVGYLPENLRIPPHHTARTAMEYYGRLSGLTLSRIAERRDELLKRVGLLDRAKDSVRKYSKGMLQRLGLAQALLHDPRLLILDEPTDGLDPTGRAEVRAVLADLKNEGKTVFVNSHILQEVELICDRVAILNRGELLRVGSLEELSPDQGGAIELQVLVGGEAETVRSALGERAPQESRTLPCNQFQFTLQLKDQAEVDRLIDDLRSRKLSIIDLSRRRLTLEDVFLKVVAASPADAAAK